MYYYLMYAHLATILPAFVIGTYLIFAKKGTKSHRFFGKIYFILMLVTATIVLFMSSDSELKLFGHFGFLHLFCFLAYRSVYLAHTSLKKGDLKTHKNSMIGLYVGGILIAGGFAFMPGRFLHELFFTAS